MAEEPKNYYITLDQQMPIQQWVLLFYGPSGTMKTRTAAQFPKPMFISCERGHYGGLISAREFNPMQVVVKTYDDIIQLLPRLKKDAGNVFHTIVLDSATELQHIVMNEVLRQSGKTKPTFDEWGLHMSRMRSLIKSITEFNCHAIVIATQQYDKDPETEKLIGEVGLMTKIASEFPHWFDITIRFTTRINYGSNGTKSTEYIMNTTPTERWHAKDTSGLLKPVMVTPEGGSHFTHLKPLVEFKTV